MHRTRRSALADRDLMNSTRIGALMNVGSDVASAIATDRDTSSRAIAERSHSGQANTSQAISSGDNRNKSIPPRVFESPDVSEDEEEDSSFSNDQADDSEKSPKGSTDESTSRAFPKSSSKQASSRASESPRFGGPHDMSDEDEGCKSPWSPNYLSPEQNSMKSRKKYASQSPRHGYTSDL